MSTLLEDMVSLDSTRVWSATSTLVTLRDVAELDLLSGSLPEIRRSTQNLDLGGVLFPNAERLKFALRKLEFYKNKEGCLCRLYPEYLLYDPRKEAEAGNVHIKTITYTEDKWVDAYLCQCTFCGARFRVEEREYHYTWWGWSTLTA